MTLALHWADSTSPLPLSAQKAFVEQACAVGRSVRTCWSVLLVAKCGRRPERSAGRQPRRSDRTRRTKTEMTARRILLPLKSRPRATAPPANPVVSGPAPCLKALGHRDGQSSAPPWNWRTGEEQATLNVVRVPWSRQPSCWRPSQRFSPGRRPGSVAGAPLEDC